MLGDTHRPKNAHALRRDFARDILQGFERHLADNNLGEIQKSLEPFTMEYASKARAEAFDVILGNHMLYCTVCNNTNENCTVHNTAVALNIRHQEHPYKPKPYEVDMSESLLPL
jgi:hypothetical protein